MVNQKFIDISKGRTNWRYILIVVILAVIAGGAILGWKYWLAPPHFDISTSKYVCRDGNFAATERLDQYRNSICNDCVTKTAYICGKKFWINEYGGFPGSVVDKWSGPYDIKRIKEFQEVPISSISPISPSEIEDETANWRTYRNGEYGFEFKYPEKLPVEWGYSKGTSIEEYKGFSSLPEGTVYSGDLPYVFLVVVEPGMPASPLLSLGIFRDVTLEQRMNHLQNVFPEARGYPEIEILPTKQIFIAGNEAKQFFLIHPHFFEFGSDRILFTLMQHGSNLYEFTIVTSEDDPGQELWNQMLSTFRFLK